MRPRWRRCPIDAPSAGWCRPGGGPPGARTGGAPGPAVPQLAAVRGLLAAALDDALHPGALAPGRAEMPRRYNFSLGLALAEQPLVAAALRLLAIAAGPGRFSQAEFGELLRGPIGRWPRPRRMVRARLDGLLRERLPPEPGLAAVLRLARRQRSHRGLRIAACVGHLEALQDFGKQPGGKQAAGRMRPSQGGWC